MDHYDIWCNLAPGADDLEFVAAAEAYLRHLQSKVGFPGYHITRRKFGFGPSELGEFHIRISFDNLAQLDAAFSLAAERAGEIEELHHAVYSRVRDFRSGLYRDFPDPVRGTTSHASTL